jgi:hypothetical protein
MSSGLAASSDDSVAVAVDSGIFVSGWSTSLSFASGGSSKGSSRLVLLASGASGLSDASDRTVAGGSRQLCAVVAGLDGIVSLSSVGTIGGASAEVTGGSMSATSGAAGNLLLSGDVAKSVSGTAVGGDAVLIDGGASVR